MYGFFAYADEGGELSAQIRIEGKNCNGFAKQGKLKHIKLKTTEKCHKGVKQ